MLLLVALLAPSFEPPPATFQQQPQQPQQPQQQQQALNHAQALVKLITLGQALTPAQQQNGAGGISILSGAAAVAHALRDPAQRASIMQLLQSLMQPGMIQAVLKDAEKVVGPMPPNVMEDAQKMEAAASRIRKTWSVLAPVAEAPPRPEADDTGLPPSRGAQEQMASTAPPSAGGGGGAGGSMGGGGGGGMEASIRAASSDMARLRPRPDAKGLAFIGKLKANEHNLAGYAEEAATRMQRESAREKRPDAVFARNLDKLSAAADKAVQREEAAGARQAEKGFMLEEQRAGAQRQLESSVAMQREGQSPQQQDYAKVLAALSGMMASHNQGVGVRPQAQQQQQQQQWGQQSDQRGAVASAPSWL